MTNLTNSSFVKVITVFTPESSQLIKKIGRDIMIAYKLKESAKVFGSKKDIEFTQKQFETLRNSLEILARFHSITRFVYD